MKKTLFKKSIWQSVLSTLVLGIFIWFAFGSSMLSEDPPKPGEYNTETKSLGEGIFQESYGSIDLVSEKQEWYSTQTGQQDKHGFWFGPIVIKNLLNGSYEQVNMLLGVRNGISKTTVANGEIVIACYDMGERIPCEKSAHLSISESSAFQILSYKYPWYLNLLNASGFNNEYIEAYMDTLETVINSYEFDESGYGGFYGDAISELEETPYDSIIYVNSVWSEVNGIELTKKSEFRMAVIDRFWAGEPSTFASVETTYPGYLLSLNGYYGVNDLDFEAFCQYFDSLLVSYGTLELEDPFFVDSLDSRMYRAILYMMALEDSTKSEIKSLKSGGMFALNKKIETVLNNINPKLKSFVLGLPPKDVAERVAYSIYILTYNGEIIQGVVNKALKGRHDLISLPTVTTEFIGNNSATSATVQGNVIENGGAEVRSRGIAWATTYNPTIENQIKSSGKGVGTYPVSITDLSPGTTYYARAYATNSSDWTAYGNCIKFNSATTGIFENELSDWNFDVFPNPASNNVTFRFEVEQSESLVLTIVNLNGQVVFQNDLGSLPYGENQTQLNLSSLQNGMYYCQLNNGTAKVTRKLMIER